MHGSRGEPSADDLVPDMLDDLFARCVSNALVDVGFRLAPEGSAGQLHLVDVAGSKLVGSCHEDRLRSVCRDLYRWSGACRRWRDAANRSPVWCTIARAIYGSCVPSLPWFVDGQSHAAALADLTSWYGDVEFARKTLDHADYRLDSLSRRVINRFTRCYECDVRVHVYQRYNDLVMHRRTTVFDCAAATYLPAQWYRLAISARKNCARGTTRPSLPRACRKTERENAIAMHRNSRSRADTFARLDRPSDERLKLANPGGDKWVLCVAHKAPEFFRLLLDHDRRIALLEEIRREMTEIERIANRKRKRAEAPACESEPERKSRRLLDAPTRRKK